MNGQMLPKVSMPTRKGFVMTRDNQHCATFATHVAYFLSILPGFRAFALVRLHPRPYGGASPQLL
jgi:hypothetical protein